MTEKRFDIIKSAIIDGAKVIRDNENKYTFATTFKTATLINYRKALNELNDENKQLKMKNASLKLLVQGWEALDEEKDEQLDKQNQALKKLKKENLDLSEELDYYKMKCASLETGYIKAEDENWRLEKSKMEFINELGKTIDENEQLKTIVKEVIKLLSEEVDVFSDKATEHDINAYIELKELDNKDAYYMATATKKAIKLLKGVVDD